MHFNEDQEGQYNSNHSDKWPSKRKARPVKRTRLRKNQFLKPPMPHHPAENSEQERQEIAQWIEDMETFELEHRLRNARGY